MFVAVCERRYFHSSICKNTAHQFAIDMVEGGRYPKGTRQFLVNLDADNVIYGEWLRAALDLLWEDDKYTCSWKFNGEDLGCTGRIGVDMETFISTRGYCEELPFPTGSQDALIVMQIINCLAVFHMCTCHRFVF